MSKEIITAFILLITDSNSTQEILKKLRSMELVKEAFIIYGDWDIVCKVEVEKLSKLTDFMMDIRKRFVIKKSSTLIALDE